MNETHDPAQTWWDSESRKSPYSTVADPFDDDDWCEACEQKVDYSAVGFAHGRCGCTQTVKHSSCGTECEVRENYSQATRETPRAFLGESAFCPTCDVSFHPPEANGMPLTGLRFVSTR
jgi:hypothetical protein